MECSLTELIWEGKYDKEGRKVAPLRVRLPFQTVETVNESAQQRQRTLDLFSSGRPAEWRNRLIWGDKKYVLPALLDEFAGQVNLIYIDPPFDTGQDFSFNAKVNGEEFLKEPSVIEQKAYRDTWGRGLDSYLQWFYETVVFLNELLNEKGSIYIHLDWHVSHYAKVILDNVFGSDKFVNEIVWKRSEAHSDSSAYGKVHDVVLLFRKGDTSTWNKEFVPYSDEFIIKQYRYTEEGTNRRYRSADLSASGLSGGGYMYEWKGITRSWRCPLETMLRYEKEGRLDYTGKGLVRYKYYLDEMQGLLIQDVWDDVNKIHHLADERLGYETQKPEAILERILKTSSNEGDLVLDCFVGSGTTAAVAEKLNRRWIAADLGRFAIHTTRKRLLSIPGVKPFIVQNLGKYERQLWQSAEFGEHAEQRVLAYRNFILDLYHARPITGYNWLHGVKAGHLVHIGAVDSPVSPGDVTQIAGEFKRAVGTGKDAPATNSVDVLGWDFAFELNEVAKQQAAQANINMRFLRIPREVLEKKAVEQGDIKFFELAALSVEVKRQERTITLKLTDFVIPPDDVPEDVRQTITNWEQWVDYWAVDWNNRDDTFHNEWQDYRTRKKRELQKTISHTYEQPGTYIIMVKVIDILGNDTTKTLKVEVR
jgi:adenine-specific DNA-methyltransferase